jgi:hypothetical protein
MMAFGSPTEQQVDAATRNGGFSTATTIDTRQSKIAMQEQAMGAATYLDPDRAYNPPPDARAWAVSPTGMGSARAPKLLRGRLSMWSAEKTKIPGASQKRSRSLNFLYNPNTITHSYEFDPSSIPPPSLQPDDESPVLMSGQSVAWKLYFNRQYDVMAGNDADGNDVRNNGVLADVQALERILGVYKPGMGVSAQLVLAVFGSTRTGLPFGYFGWITQINVTYMMFTHRMIPTVAEVDIQMARRMMPTTVESVPNTGAGTAYPGGTGQANSLTPEGNANPQSPTQVDGGYGQSARTAGSAAQEQYESGGSSGFVGGVDPLNPNS